MSENGISITRGTTTKKLNTMQRLEKAKAIIFDLHHTITETRESPSELFRNILEEYEIATEGISEEQFHEAFQYMDRWMAQYQIDQNVGPHWGGKPEDWLQADKIMLQRLGYNIDNERILQMEQKWKRETKSPDFEWVIREAIDTIKDLHTRGYTLAIATRRHDNPTAKIKHAGIGKFISCVEWSGVAGYAKPNPFTLLSVSRQIGINPKLCAYVGNYVDLDVEAAKRAGMIPILTVWGNPEEKSKAEKGTIIIDSISELANLLPGY